MGNRLFEHLQSLGKSLPAIQPQPLVINLPEPAPEFAILRELRAKCAKLIERTKEALLEARDETDIRWVRDAAIRGLNEHFSIVSGYNSEFSVLKLEALEDIEHECRLGHIQAMIRSVKWRQALVARFELGA
jgi:hypothetical protein